MRRKVKTRRFVTPFVKSGQQFSLHLDQKYECLDIQQNEARNDSTCVPSLRSSVYVGEGVRGSFSGLFETRISKDGIPEPQSDGSIVKWNSREKTPVHDDSSVQDKHVPWGFCAYTVSSDPEFETGPVTYSGRDCLTVFYDHLAGEQHRIASILANYHEMLPLTREEQERFDQTRACVASTRSGPSSSVPGPARSRYD
jgi:hypothetical protein